MSSAAQSLSNLERLFFALDSGSATAELAWLCTLAGRVGLAQLQRFIEPRLAAVPHAYDRVVLRRTLPSATWVRDEDFAIQRHVKLVPTKGTKPSDLLLVCSRLLEAPWDQSHPLWELYLLQPRSGSSALLLRVHRGMLPWENESVFLNALLAPQPRPPRTITPAAPLSSWERPLMSGATPASKWLARSLSTVYRLLKNPLTLTDEARGLVRVSIGTLRTLLTPAPRLADLNGPLTGRKNLAFVSFPFSDLRQIRDRIGGTALEIVLSCIVGGIAVALARHVEPMEREEILLCVPLTSGSEQDAQRTGTRTTLGIGRFPLDVKDPVERLRRVSAEVDLLRALGIPEQFRQSVSLCRELPSTVFEGLLTMLPRSAPVHSHCLELPGLRERRYIAGREVTQVIPLAAPTLDVRLSFALHTYATQFVLGVTADSALSLRAREVAADIASAARELTEAIGLIDTGTTFA